MDKDAEQNKESNKPAASGALECQSTSMLQYMQPRQPRSLPDLLRYATEVAKQGESSQQAQNAQPIDEENKQFLTDYLSSLSVDVISELKEGIETVEKCIQAAEFDQDECDEALEKILNCVDKIDFAQDFYKIQGFRIFTPCLTHHSAYLRWRCCELIAEICQNNSFCQDKCVEEGYLPLIVDLIDKDASELVRVKAFYAISCIVRDNEKALTEFVAKDGYSVILRCLQSDVNKLKIKAAFLLSSLCFSRPAVTFDLLSMGFVEQLLCLITQNKSNLIVLEYLLSATSTIIRDSAEARDICIRPDFSFQIVLKNIITDSKGKDDAAEVLDHAYRITQILFKKTVEENETEVAER